MTKVLREFDSICRGQHYTYKVVETKDEYQLQSFKGGQYFERVSWTKTERNLELINLACDDIDTRKHL